MTLAYMITKGVFTLFRFSCPKDSLLLIFLHIALFISIPDGRVYKLHKLIHLFHPILISKISHHLLWWFANILHLLQRRSRRLVAVRLALVVRHHVPVASREECGSEAYSDIESTPTRSASRTVRTAQPRAPNACP